MFFSQAFTEAILVKMAEMNKTPIVFALSNPTSKAECTAQQAYAASDGRCVFAADMHAGMHACMHIHPCVHTYIRTYIHTYIHTFICMYVYTYRCVFASGSPFSDVTQANASKASKLSTHTYRCVFASGSPFSDVTLTLSDGRVKTFRPGQVLSLLALPVQKCKY